VAFRGSANAANWALDFTMV